MLSREELLQASDITEKEINLPSIQGRVRVRSLPAAYSNQAQSEAVEMITGPRGEQTARVNMAKLEALQVLHGLVDPKLNSIEDAYTLSQRTGPAWRAIVDAIDSISGIDKAAIADTNARFQGGGDGEGRPDVGAGDSPRNGSGRSDLPVRAGA